MARSPTSDEILRQILLPSDHPDRTLDVSRSLLREDLRTGGTHCLLCGQDAKIYKRKFSSGMAILLVKFHRYSLKAPGWVRAAKVPWFLGARDMGKLALWGLVEEANEKTFDKNPHCGFWRMAERGVLMATGRTKIERHVYIYNNALLAYSVEDPIGIQEALGNTFRYDELMDEPIP